MSKIIYVSFDLKEGSYLDTSNNHIFHGKGVVEALATDRVKKGIVNRQLRERTKDEFTKLGGVTTPVAARFKELEANKAAEVKAAAKEAPKKEEAPKS